MISVLTKNLLRSFLKRCGVIAAIVFLLSLIAIPSLIYLYHLHQYERDTQKMVRNFISAQLTEAPETILNTPLARQLLRIKLESIMTFGDMLDIKICDRTGVVLYAFKDSSAVGLPSHDEEVLEVLRNGKEIVNRCAAEKTEISETVKEGRVVEVFAPIWSAGNVVGAVEIYRKAPTYEVFTSHVVMVIAASIVIFALLYLLLYGQFKIAASALIAHDSHLQDAYRSLGKSHFDTIKTLINALEQRDMETEGHSARVVRLAAELGKRLDLEEDEMDQLIVGAYVHDVGKIGVPDSILLKKGPLTKEERETMEKHVVKGREIIHDSIFLRSAENVLLYHHEKWDGTGYPSRVKGLTIPKAARIFAVIDVFDALVSDRPYRDGMSVEEATAILEAERGTSFDPEVLDAFMQMIDAGLATGNADGHSADTTALIAATIDHLLVQEKVDHSQAPAKEKRSYLRLVRS